MEKQVTPKNSLMKSTVTTIIFIVSIMVFGVSISYAYYTANFKGNSEVPSSTAAQLDVTTTLTTVPVINAAQLAIIEPSEYLTKGEKVSFSITNEATSNVKAKYVIKIVEMSLSENLFSKYLKWSLVVNHADGTSKTFNGDFSDESHAEGNSSTTKVDKLSKTLIADDEAIVLNIDSTDQLTFYIWLENDDTVDQLYLTNGDFQGKISMNAVPTK